MGTPQYVVIKLPLCSAGIVWTGCGRKAEVIRIFLGEKSPMLRRSIKRSFPGARKGKRRDVGKLIRELSLYAEGGIRRFRLSMVSKSGHSQFQRAVARRAREVPYGKVAAYKGLADSIGVASARAVGNALAKNPFPLIVPCHRIVSSDGKIGGFQCGLRLKRNLLGAEGVKFDREGRIPEEYFVKRERG